VTLADSFLRIVATGGYQLLRAGWFVRRPRTYGAHALALTPERKLMIEHNVYTEVVALLEGSTLHEWTEPGTKIKSPEDAKVAITNRLRQIALAYERKAYGG